MRPDCHVLPTDVPVDPARGLTVGTNAPKHPAGTAFADTLANQIVDQPAAVSAVAERLRIVARGLHRTGPRASLLLAGPPGSGKTHTAGVIAATYFGDPEAVIRIDCGAMYDRHTISSLLGTPPGYVGYDDRERLLTTQITRRNGRCVVLVDEIEKADRRVLDILLGVLDTGLLTDLQGRAANAADSIFLLTSNLGSALFTRQQPGFSPTSDSNIDTAVLAEVRQHLRPELLDRIDDVVIYRPLTRAGITELTRRHLATLTHDLRIEGYNIQIEPVVEDHLADHIETLGVRALRRYLETTLLRDLLTLPTGQYRAALDAGKVIWHPADPVTP